MKNARKSRLLRLGSVALGIGGFSSRFTFTCLFCLVLMGIQSWAAPAPRRSKAAPVVIRIGVSEYQNTGEVYERYSRLFHDLATLAPADQPVSFQVAVGGYREVIEWWEKKEIDAAVLAATPVAMLFKSLQDKRNQIRRGKDARLRTMRVDGELSDLENSYVATMGKQFNETAPHLLHRLENLTSAEDSRLHGVIGDTQTAYHTVAVIPNRPELRNINTIDDLLKLGKAIEFLYVRPYSASGYILPKHFLSEKLKDAKIKTNETFTFQQQRSLDWLLGDYDLSDAVPVAFVHDDVDPSAKNHDSKLKVLSGNQQLDDNPIPFDALLVNYNFEETWKDNKALLRSLVSQYRDRNSDWSFVVEPNWKSSYAGLESWLSEIDLPDDLEYHLSLDDIIANLVKYQQQTGEKPRLALVLSGGGAKCAYQAGVIQAIEAKFEKQRQSCSAVPESDGGPCTVLRDLDINLVVGTSGGSINALFVALNTTKNPSLQKKEDRNRLTKLWTSLRLNSLINPSERFLFWFSTWFGLVQCVVISVLASIYASTVWSWKRFLMALPILLIGAEVLAGLVQLRLNSEFYLIFSTAIVLLVVGMLGTFQKKRIGRRTLLLVPGAIIFVILIVCAAVQGAYSVSLILWVFALIGLQIAAMSIIFGFMALLRRWNPGWASWWDFASWSMLAVSVLQLLFSLIWQKWGELPLSYHWFDRIFLLQSLPFRIATVIIPIPIAIGLLMIGLPYLLRALKVEWQWDRKQLIGVGSITLAALIVSTITMAILFEKEVSPTDSAEITQAMANALPLYYKDVVTRISNGSAVEKLRNYSLQIIGENKIQRDLVITASRLHGETEDSLTAQLPDDLYFYYQTGDDSPAESERQFISFDDENEDKLLQTVVGSGTIYPVFPPERLDTLAVYDKNGNRQTVPVQIMDGGFIHNSPIDAALKWGATHIILVEASPVSDQFSTESFAGNIGNAFNYLFNQAQVRDRLSKAQAELYVLRPTCNGLHKEPVCPPAARWDMDLFDFASDPLNRAINQGWLDVDPDSAPSLPVKPENVSAKKWRVPPAPLFIRQAGSPLFTDVSLYNPPD